MDRAPRHRPGGHLENLGRSQGGLSIQVLTWNISHGREFPPAGAGPAQAIDRDYARANRNLFPEFAEVITSTRWDYAFLQECPPKWVSALARATGSAGEWVPTARNWMSPFTWSLATRRPNLIGSWEGGSNAILVRRGRSVGLVNECRTVVLTRLPERRRLLFLGLEDGLCLANFHASTGRGNAERDVLLAARQAIGLAAGRPLVLGGDFNCRPASSDVFRQLEWEFGLTGAGNPEGIDHLLSPGSPKSVRTAELPDRLREPLDRSTGRVLRLSDHPLVVSDFVS